RPLAMAATILCAAALAVWLGIGVGLTPDPVQTAAVPSIKNTADPNRSAGLVEGTQPPSEAGMSARNAALKDRSVELEKTWRELSRQSASVQRLAHTERANRLKSRVSLLDASYDQLPADDYWQRRVDLLDALVSLEQAERMVRFPAYNVMRSPAQPMPVRMN
ncbi:MAG: hypothetical protein AAFU65_06230, partial [Pseudomonadota bacterium]